MAEPMIFLMMYMKEPQLLIAHDRGCREFAAGTQAEIKDTYQKCRGQGQEQSDHSGSW
jgi:hypothetical protein